MLLPINACEQCGRIINPARLVSGFNDVMTYRWQCVDISLTPGRVKMTHTCISIHKHNDPTRWDGAPVVVDGLAVMSYLMSGGYSPSPGLSDGLRQFGVRPCCHCGRRFKPSTWSPKRHPRWGLDLRLTSDDEGRWPWLPESVTANCPWCGEGKSVVCSDRGVDVVRMFLDTMLLVFPATIPSLVPSERVGSRNTDPSHAIDAQGDNGKLEW